MKELGSLLLLFGIGSFALNMIGYEFSLLMWIDNWGQTVGYAIRGGMIAVGGVLYFVGMKAGKGEEAPQEQASREQASQEEDMREAA